MPTTDRVFDVAVMAMEEEDVSEVLEAIQAENQAHAQWEKAVKNTQQVKDKVLKRILDRIPESVLED